MLKQETKTKHEKKDGIDKKKNGNLRKAFGKKWIKQQEKNNPKTMDKYWEIKRGNGENNFKKTLRGNIIFGTKKKKWLNKMNKNKQKQ